MRNLREAHAHVANLGRQMAYADLSACTSSAQALERMAEHASGLGPLDWAIGVGARPEGWRESAWPGLAELDAAIGGRPAAVWCFDNHTLMASTAALAAAGIGDDSPAPEGGAFGRDGGALDGVMYEAAALQLWAAVPEPTDAQHRAHLRAGLAHLRGLGFVEVHDMLSHDWTVEHLLALDADGELDEIGIRVELYCPVAELDDIAARFGTGALSNNITIAGGKIFADGTLNSRTAYMLGPYADGDPSRPRGMPLLTDAQIRNAVAKCDALGIGLATHAIGDGAVRDVLDAIEEVGPNGPGVFRIEHAEVVDEDDIPRFAALGVPASVQPCHLLPDIEVLRRALPDRLGRVLPLRELIDSGAEVWFGSDVPIVRADAEDSVRAATERRREGMAPSLAIASEQAITEAEAWRAFAPS
ncbi:MAG: amidohydrolase family protein [Planctomycetota bacterium]